MIKKLLVILTVLLCVFMTAGIAGASIPAPGQSQEDIRVDVDGKTLAFGDVLPLNINGRILVPLRVIFEEMGAEVVWDANTATVKATKGDTAVVLTIGDNSPTINGEAYGIDQPGIILDGRILAPLRFVAEAFGGTVDWDGPNQTATITTLNQKEAESPAGTEKEETATKLLYQGHASFRITAADGTVIFVDPYAGEGYDLPADIVLITHQHQDHNKLDLVKRKPGCRVITNVGALEGGVYNSFNVNGVEIEAVEAGNQNHDPAECVGYIITVDGIKIYAAGDTSKTEAMGGFAARKLDYALLPCDGIFNMDAAEAAECAELIGARHNIPIHMKPGELFDRAIAEAFTAPNRLILEAGEEIALDK